MTYYEILEISENASEEVIKMAYKALAKKYHPDVFQGDRNEAEEKMKQINVAYSILSDAAKRAQYDAFLKKKNEKNTAETQNAHTRDTSASQNAPKNKESGKSKKGFHIATIAAVFFCVIFGALFLKPTKNIEQIKDSVVAVNVYDEEETLVATGSGFCAYENDWIVTNFHVIEGARTITVTTDERETITVTGIVLFNKKEDLAVLQIDGKLRPLALGDGDRIKTKDRVTTIGSPKGELNTVSEGIISNVDDKKQIRISAPISHGSSGGVVLNRKNEVIGITSAGYNDAQNLNFAINISVLEGFYSKFKESGAIAITSFNYENYIGDDLSAFEENLQSSLECYSVSTLSTFYRITDNNKRFEKLLGKVNSYWYSIYVEMDSADQNEVVELFLKLNRLKYDDENVAADIRGWSVSDFFISLGILEEYEYAIACVDIGNYSDKRSIFDRVDYYPVDVAERVLIMHLIGGYEWRDIHTSNKKDIFDYFVDKYHTEDKYDMEDLGAILEVLGYEVVYSDDGDLSAYW
ncbi:MAG: DnaJ domain-containing protein [Oscillospiraceae bacterium]|nr:DnaJ domain-containing protein [Oscillospiraceae bacterium]